MDKILSCCGYRCDLCPAYRENVSGLEHQRRIAEGWRHVYGVSAKPADVYCDGCLDMRTKAKRIETDCKVRACVLEKGLSHCGRCADCPCAETNDKPQSRADVERRMDRALSEEEYRLFVQPYEADRHLQSALGADETEGAP